MNYSENIINKLVSKYLRTKYGSSKHINCHFDIYEIDIEKNGGVRKDKHEVVLSRREYATLLKTLLFYPNLTFQDLPMYVSHKLYSGLAFRLRFPYYGNLLHLYFTPRRTSPRAVEMTQLQRDVREIEETDACFFSLPTTGESVYEFYKISIRLNQMEIRLWHPYKMPSVEVRYLGIDAIEVKRLLGVDDYQGMEHALEVMSQTIHDQLTPNPFWFIHWLDEHKVKYDYIEEDRKRIG